MSYRVVAKFIKSAVFDYLRKKYDRDIQVLGNQTDRNGTLTDALKKAGFTDYSYGQEIDMILDKRAVNYDVCHLKEL